ncbi:MAG TPA: hypothetical protein PL033_01175 [Candidatus Brocadiia bacterium]|nr:hypothetical protein [Candidatus Brocadiia bacterium]
MAEMLIAIGLASLLMMIIMSGFYMAYDLMRSTRGRTEAHHQLRACHRMLRDDLAMAMEDAPGGNRGIFAAAHSQANPWAAPPPMLYWGYELASALPGGYTGPKMVCPPSTRSDAFFAYNFSGNRIYCEAMAMTRYGTSALLFKTSNSLAGASESVVLYYVRERAYEQLADRNGDGKVDDLNGDTRIDDNDLYTIPLSHLTPSFGYSGGQSLFPVEELPTIPPPPGVDLPQGYGRRGELVRLEFDAADWMNFEFAPAPGGDPIQFGPCRVHKKFHIEHLEKYAATPNLIPGDYDFKVGDILFAATMAWAQGYLVPRKVTVVAENVVGFRARFLSREYTVRLPNTDYRIPYRTWGADTRPNIDTATYTWLTPNYWPRVVEFNVAPNIFSTFCEYSTPINDPCCWNSRNRTIRGVWNRTDEFLPSAADGYPYMQDQIPEFAEIWLKVADAGVILRDGTDNTPVDLTRVMKVGR